MKTKQIAKKWDCSERWVRDRCREGMVPSASKVGNKWEIPSEAEKPPCAAGFATMILENMIEISNGNKVNLVSPRMRRLGEEVLEYLSSEGFISIIENEGAIENRISNSKVLKRGIDLITKTRNVSIEDIEKKYGLSLGLTMGIVNLSLEYENSKCGTK